MKASVWYISDQHPFGSYKILSVPYVLLFLLMEDDSLSVCEKN